MAQAGGIQADASPYALGVQESFVFPGNIVFPGVQSPVYTGSQLGVPAVDAIAGETPSTGAQGALAYGQATAGQPAHKQPIFWAIVAVVVGTLILTHAARISQRA